MNIWIIQLRLKNGYAINILELEFCNVECCLYIGEREKNMALLKLTSSYKDYLWGGCQLVEEYNKDFKGDILAESWELSCHPDGPSRIQNGPYAGKTLQEYIEIEGYEVIGTDCRHFKIWF